MTQATAEKAAAAQDLEEAHPVTQADDALAEISAARDAHKAMMLRIRGEALKRKRVAGTTICTPGFREFLDDCGLGSWDPGDERDENPPREVELSLPGEDITEKAWMYSASGMQRLVAEHRAACEEHKAHLRKRVIRACRDGYVSSELCDKVLEECGMPPVATSHYADVRISGIFPLKGVGNRKFITDALIAAIATAIGAEVSVISQKVSDGEISVIVTPGKTLEDVSQ